MTTTFQQTVHLPGTPAQVFRALTDSAQHAAYTGAPAEIDARAGGRFSSHGGQIEGTTLELVPGERLVQAWRPAAWPAGVFSLVRFDLTATDGGTQVVLTHSSVPAGAEEMLQQGWHQHYWSKMPTVLEA